MPSKPFWRTLTRSLIFIALLAQTALVFSLLSAYLGWDLFVRFRQPTSSRLSPSLFTESGSFQGDGFILRHVFHHAAGQPGPKSRRLDVSSKRVMQAAEASHLGPFPIKTTSIRIDKPAVQQHHSQMPISTYWVADDVPGPNVEDKETVVNFARMSEDAYKPDPSDPEWMDIGEKFNNSIPFGWEDSGIRGHVFSDASNSTIILSVKGTSVAVFEGNGTSGRDKENDNLFGSCCCGQGGAYLWHQVCDCQTGTYTCDNKCVKDELRQPSKYYEATLELYDEVIQLYPDANIFTVGHSLGGVLASLIGLRHGLPSVTFETYPQALAAARLGLPSPGQSSIRRNTGGFHFGHSADPIFMGTCNGASSFCSIAGYAFETTCHTGRKCIYDVVKDWGWRQSTNYHRLRYSIANVYEKYDNAAPCQDEDLECEDCYLWKFENGTHTKPPTTTTSSTTTRTRTETCKTPGWWGCRDESTTTQPSTTEPSTITTTSTCKTPGWFGCKDQTTTGSTTTSDATTTTCTSKGWFGRCLDDLTATTTPAAEAVAYWRTAPTATQTIP